MAIKANKTAHQASDLTIAWMQANMFDLHIYCALRRNSANKVFRLWIPMARQEFNRRKRRFNFCTSPGFEPEPGGVTGYLLLVSHPSPKFLVINHPGTSCHPSAEGNLDRDGTSQVPLHWRGGGLPPGWLETAELAT